jgi:hypothetical protein
LHRVHVLPRITVIAEVWQSLHCASVQRSLEPRTLGPCS